MHDLRRQALLESGKTVSRKARSKTSSPATSRPSSRAPSRVASRAVSRAGSDEEESGNLSDETSFSVNSIDEMLKGDALDSTSEAWRTELADRVEELIDRKRSSVEGREKCLATYIRILTAQYSEEEINGKEEELVAALLKSIKTESSEKETNLALKALAITIITTPSDVIYDSVATPLSRTISNSTSVPTKTAAIHTLGACTFYGGASDDEILDNMTFFLEIIGSDGQQIDAHDEPAPVIAALEEWGFLATLVDDIEFSSEEAIETFVDQLGSSNAHVQIAAGENIALLYEKSYKPITDEVLSDYSDSDIISDPDGIKDVPKLVQVYTPYRRTDQLLHTFSELASTNTHRLSKKDQKSLRTNFSDILNSVEAPTHGPRYQKAVDQFSGKRYGSRMTVKIHDGGFMRIDKWWKLHRLQGLRRVLQGGFVGHYEKNKVVFETLPIMITPGDEVGGKRKKDKVKKVGGEESSWRLQRADNESWE